MPRRPRVVVPHVPHHVTQRGNRQQRVFFADDDYAAYRDLLGEHCARTGTAVWAYCLMPNHVHLILVPSQSDGLRAALAPAHRKYASRVNRREGWRGHLWQDRFFSFPMDEPHLLAAVRYVECNPVRAGLVSRPGDWPWSSAGAHLDAREDGVLTLAPLRALIPDWAGYLAEALEESQLDRLRAHVRHSRPLGGESFVARLEALTGKELRARKPGRKPGVKMAAQRD